MALRSPLYLDSEALLSQAEYYEIEVPHQAEIVERTTRRRSTGAKVGLLGTGVGVDASGGTDVEYQSSYTLTPRASATTSRVIDALIAEDVVKSALDGDVTLVRDDLVELEGQTRVTAASLAGKMFYILRRVLGSDAIDLGALDNFDLNSFELFEHFKQVYLANELLPIPVLLEMTDTGLPQKVYVSVRPGHFVDAASADRLEGDLRVLGTVTNLVASDDEGFLSAEQWLLHGWEYLIRRHVMLDVDERVKELVQTLDLNLPAEDVHGYLTGPAVVIDAVALY